MITKGILKTFRAIFLHLPAESIVQEMQISEDYLNKIINAPQEYPLAIFFRIGEILGVSEWHMIQLIYAQALQQPKQKTKKNVTEALSKRNSFLNKKGTKVVKSKGKSKVASTRIRSN